jgi:hypothetical protein
MAYEIYDQTPTNLSELLGRYGITPSMQQQDAAPDLNRLASSYGLDQPQQVAMADTGPFPPGMLASLKSGGSYTPSMQTGSMPALPAGMPMGAQAQPMQQPMQQQMPQRQSALPNVDLAALAQKYEPTQTNYGPQLKEAIARNQAAQSNFDKTLDEMSANPANRGPSKAEMYFNLAAALAQPTRTGQFTETLGNASGVLGKHSAAQSAADAANRQDQQKLAFERRKLELEAAKGDVNAIRTLASEEMKDRRAVTGKLLEAQIKADQPDKPYFTPVQTANGIYAFNARTGNVERVADPADINGGTIIGSQSDPALQKAIAEAKGLGKGAADISTNKEKQNISSNKLLANIEQADALLDAGPTESGIGSAVDSVNRVFGKSTPSAQAANELEILGSWMTSNVPRMEGPQSEGDRAFYKEMAAKVGDRTVPVAERKAGLKILRRIHDTYKHLNTGSSNAVMPTGSDIDAELARRAARRGSK